MLVDKAPRKLVARIQAFIVAGLAIVLAVCVSQVYVVVASASFTNCLQCDQVANQGTVKPRAQSIILFIGDGMGASQRTAARWSAVGQDGALAMDAMPFGGWSHTGSADNPVTDSAAAATALATGIKTNNRVIGQDPAGNPLTTILERAKARGLSVGLVSTTQMAHATPASFASHVSDRGMMTEIARQMLAAGVDVMLGGGENEFLRTTDTGCYPQPGKRTDERNLIAEAISTGYTYVCDAAAFAAVVPTSTTRLLGLFADEGMTRPFSPSLAEMTQKAIDILSQDPDGFFLMVEGGQIDWACHANDAANAIADTIGFDEAVAAAQTYAANAGNVQIIVTADHETGAISVSLTSSGLPGEDGPFYMPDGTPFYVNWATGGHTGGDVPTTAQGPWSSLLDGTYENTHVHDVMRQALDAWIGLDISGPTMGAVQTSYTFTATVSPVTATVVLPITFDWQATEQSVVTNTTGLSDTVSFTWTTTGTQAITVTATNAEGTVSSSHTIDIYLVRADFIALPTSGIVPLTVTFSNTSVGAYTARLWDSLWDFGDTVTSTLENPTHTYTMVGAYTVTLTLSGPSGSYATVKREHIIVWRERIYLPLILRSSLALDTPQTSFGFHRTQ
ncbi:MAG: alkaline phosphatase [Anaerolineae bacterium]